MDNDREVDELRHIVERVEDQNDITPNDANVTTLKGILERKIVSLQTEIDSASEEKVG